MPGKSQPFLQGCGWGEVGEQGLCRGKPQLWNCKENSAAGLRGLLFLREKQGLSPFPYLCADSLSFQLLLRLCCFICWEERETWILPCASSSQSPAPPPCKRSCFPWPELIVSLCSLCCGCVALLPFPDLETAQELFPVHSAFMTRFICSVAAVRISY